MDSLIEKYCAQYISCYENHDMSDIRDVVNAIQHIIDEKPEMILDANVEALIPLVMITTEFDMGDAAIEMAYYVALKALKQAEVQNDKKNIKIYVQLCLVYITEHYETLNRLLIIMRPRIPFYHLDCQLHSFSKIYQQFLSISEQEYIQDKIKKICYYQLQDIDKADEICNTSVTDFINSYEHRMKDRKRENEYLYF